MYRPVVLSYFSQSPDAEQEYLPFLEEEYKAIAQAWEQFQTGSDRYFEVDFPWRGRAEGDEVAEDIRKYKNRIIVFHFSGHAVSRQLLFKDGSSHASGLAGLLGESQNLKLVFLNGCATHDQVRLLFDKNVRIVVATRGKIRDGLAKEFAHLFYRALSDTDYTIRTAFEHALYELKRKYPAFDSVPTEPIVWRGLVTEAEEDKDRWELYVQARYRKELDAKDWWKLRIAKPTKKDLLLGNTLWDQTMSLLTLLLLFLGASILIYAVFFARDHVFALFGLVAVAFAFFGFRNQQRYKTIEMNAELTDEAMIRNMKLFS